MLYNLFIDIYNLFIMVYDLFIKVKYTEKKFRKKVYIDK